MGLCAHLPSQHGFSSLVTETNRQLLAVLVDSKIKHGTVLLGSQTFGEPHFGYAVYGYYPGGPLSHEITVANWPGLP
jgi:hypothetical protein